MMVQSVGRFSNRATMTMLAVACFLLTADRSLLTAQQPVEAISLSGDSLRRPVLSPETEARMLEQLRQAETDLARRPEADAWIWIGRRTAYLGRYTEAIAIYSSALARFPDDPRLYRHRGHRYLTTRQIDRAIADFLYAARLTRGQPDETEPDGQPNERNIPTSTLQSNIWYHLGLAYYVKHDFRNALAAWRQCLAVSRNPDMEVASRYWLYMTLRRMGRPGPAREVLEPVTRSMDIIENRSYHRLLLLFKGELSPDSLAAGGADRALEDATTGYGLGNWHFLNGRRDEARRVWERVVATGPWASFGYLASEAELAAR